MPVIFRARIPDLEARYDLIEINASQDGSISNLRNAVEAAKFVGKNSEGVRVLLIEEIDRLTNDASAALKGLLDSLAAMRPRIPIVSTSNDISRLETAVRDRFDMVAWPSPGTEMLLARVKVVLARKKLAMPDEEIRHLIAAANGGLRALFQRELPKAVGRKLRETARAGGQKSAEP